MQFERHVAFEAHQVAGTLLIALCGFATYAAFLAALRALFEKALYIGFFLVALVEWALASLPASGLSKCSVWHHLAVLQLRLFPEANLRSIDGLVQGVAAGLSEYRRGAETQKSPARLIHASRTSAAGS